MVPVDLLADTCAGLGELFDRYRYRDSVIFGHAKDGNIHFLITDRFADDEPLRRYADFTEDMVDLVLAQGGSLKAEHGTGRVMAPYVRRQYGDELYDVMVGIKRLIDPVGLLNPGVLLDDAPDAHLRHIKVTPTVEEEVDRCVECGYCEPVCPSRDLTLTPRQRIVVRRAIATAELAGDSALADELEVSYEYSGIQTCAVDGMCGTACPVQINTGDLVRRLRREDHGRLADKAWALAARQWGGATRAASAALTAAVAVPAALPATASRAGRAVGGTDAVPLWSPDLPAGGRPRQSPGAPRSTGCGVPAGLCQRDVRSGRRRSRRAGQRRKALRAGRNHAAGPPRHRRAVLWHAVVVEGHDDRLPHHAGGHRGRRSRRDTRRRTARDL